MPKATLVRANWSAPSASPVDPVILALGVPRHVSSSSPDLGMETPDEARLSQHGRDPRRQDPPRRLRATSARRQPQPFPGCETPIKIFCECFGRESVSIRANADQRVPTSGRKSGLAPGGDPCKALDEAGALRRTGLHVSRAAACSPGHGGRYVGCPLGRPSWFRARSRADGRPGGWDREVGGPR